MKQVRAKFHCGSITLNEGSRIRDGLKWNAGKGKYEDADGNELAKGESPHEPCNVPTVHLTARYDDTIPEDIRYNEATPNAKADLSITNAAAAEFFEIGKSYYADFTRV